MKKTAANREPTPVPQPPAADQRIAELEAEAERLQAENQRLRLLVEKLQRQLFGQRSEKLKDLGDDQGRFEALLNEVEELNRQLQQAETAATQARTVAEHTRQPRRKLDELVPADLPVKQKIVDVPEEDKICLETGNPLVRIGEERSRKLAYEPGHYFILEIVRPRYASLANPSQGVLCAPAPDCAIPYGDFDESFIAAAIVDKCAYHLPFYRQEERLRSLGIEISRQTLSRLYIQSAGVLAPLYEELKREILARKILFTDDTPVPFLVKGAGKTVTGRMWVYVAGGAGPPLRIFEFTRDRRKKRPLEFLGNYRGHIHADAFKGYDDLFRQEGVIECACWMHVRRKFFEATDAPPELRAEILRLIRNLYRYERVIAGHTAEIVLAVRRQRIGPLIDRIFARCAAILRDGLVLPRSAFAGAIGYMQSLGVALKRFLDHPDLRPDNGASERAIRPLAIGRKNWLFAGSENGGDATGILLSLVQSCRVLDVDPFRYLEDVLRRINGHKAKRLAELLPHNWKPLPALG
jgi:transposase